MRYRGSALRISVVSRSGSISLYSNRFLSSSSALTFWQSSCGGIFIILLYSFYVFLFWVGSFLIGYPMPISGEVLATMCRLTSGWISERQDFRSSGKTSLGSAFNLVSSCCARNVSEPKFFFGTNTKLRKTFELRRQA